MRQERKAELQKNMLGYFHFFFENRNRHLAVSNYIYKLPMSKLNVLVENTNKNIMLLKKN